ncbi:MAG: aminotransferase class V-fold PLP-dependent enzyme [Bacteroidota bacterium]
MSNTSRRKALKAIGLAGFGITSISTGAYPASPLLSIDKMPKDFWDSVRDQFMLDRNSVFFNPGTVGAMPRVVVERMTTHLNMLATDVAQWAYLDDNAEQYISGYNNLLPIRNAVGTLLNCSPSEIAMTDNVTNGMSYLASGLDLSEGDEIITTNQEHTGGVSSWKMRAKRHNLVYREVSIPKPIKDPSQVLNLITSSFTPKTRVLMVSHMITGSGALLPVKEICAAARKRGIITILDGAQTIGQVKVDLTEIDCDAYLGCFHKWIGAPCGTGFMYVRKDLVPGSGQPWLPGVGTTTRMRASASPNGVQEVFRS